ncbi:hypothetical protein BM221_008510 [Beauveria bassiana]|uniref:Uncharacterized protein n=1 Tax=Beauveria bassiana TaxID=176275 RepID=A0A2N6NCY6_BEABA|nr:hypothetical protein BM221_008510 [Beauveria bassiana]
MVYAFNRGTRSEWSKHFHRMLWVPLRNPKLPERRQIPDTNLSISSFRASHPSRPLVLVGHSLATAGLMFLGTPFRGSKWQPLADALAQLMRPAGSHRGITRELGFDEPALRDRVHGFCKLRNKLSTAVACFSELHETDCGWRLGSTGVAKGMVCGRLKDAQTPGTWNSANLPRSSTRYRLDKDHLKINKYCGPTDPAFERVSDAISEMCRGANDVRRRFEISYPYQLGEDRQG